jgi:hypothetical protein
MNTNEGGNAGESSAALEIISAGEEIVFETGGDDDAGEFDDGIAESNSIDDDDGEGAGEDEDEDEGGEGGEGGDGDGAGEPDAAAAAAAEAAKAAAPVMPDVERRRRLEDARERVRATSTLPDVPADAIARAVEAELGPAPKETDFPADFLAFERAATAYESAKIATAPKMRRELQERHIGALAEAQLTVEDYQARAKAVAAKIPDYSAVVKGAKAPVGDGLMREIVESEKGPLLAYHLAKNPAETARLNAMSPANLAREIGRLEQKLELPTARKATTAPAPITPLRGSAKATRDPDKMSMTEFRAWREAKGNRG